jgi:hypothetical protein
MARRSGHVVRVEHVEQHAAEGLEFGKDGFGVEVGQPGALDPVLGPECRDIDAVAPEIVRRQDRAQALVQHRHRVDEDRMAHRAAARQDVAQLLFPDAQHGLAQGQHAMGIERETLGRNERGRHKSSEQGCRLYIITKAPILGRTRMPPGTQRRDQRPFAASQSS